MSPEVYVPTVLAAAAGVGAWVKSVETRLTSHEAIMQKIDQLVTILLEDRLDGKDDRKAGSASAFSAHSRRDK